MDDFGSCSGVAEFDGNEFVSVADLLVGAAGGASVSQLISACEHSGIYGWDIFGRYSYTTAQQFQSAVNEHLSKASADQKVGVERLLSFLALYQAEDGDFSMDGLKVRDALDEISLPFSSYGWHLAKLPDFRSIEKARLEKLGLSGAPEPKREPPSAQSKAWILLRGMAEIILDGGRGDSSRALNSDAVGRIKRKLELLGGPYSQISERTIRDLVRAYQDELDRN